MTFKIYRNGKLIAEPVDYLAFCRILDQYWLGDAEVEIACDISDENDATKNSTNAQARLEDA